MFGVDPELGFLRKIAWWRGGLLPLGEARLMGRRWLIGRYYFFFLPIIFIASLLSSNITCGCGWWNYLILNSTCVIYFFFFFKKFVIPHPFFFFSGWVLDLSPLLEFILYVEMAFCWVLCLGLLREVWSSLLCGSNIFLICWLCCVYAQVLLSVWFTI